MVEVTIRKKEITQEDTIQRLVSKLEKVYASLSPMQALLGHEPGITVEGLRATLDETEKIKAPMKAKEPLLKALMTVALGYGFAREERRPPNNMSLVKIKAEIEGLRERAAEVFVNLGGDRYLLDRLKNNSYDSNDLRMLAQTCNPKTTKFIEPLAQIALNEDLMVKDIGKPPGGMSRRESEKETALIYRGETIKALGAISGSEVENILIKALKSDQKRIVFAAIIELGHIGSTAAVEPLKQLLNENSDYKSQTEAAIEQITERTMAKTVIKKKLSDIDLRL
ncbi:MAG: HEAT repeat domain-containing protein [Candidatus Micrarchaeota archaeon]